MIFAHGPVGMLATAALKPALRQVIPQVVHRNWMRLLWIGFLGGIIPDLDLFYYYLIDASESHRTFITHTPLPYLVLLVIALVWWSMRRHRWAAYGIVFAIGALSHIGADMLASEVRLLYPFTNIYIGLGDIPADAIRTNLLFINFLIEGLAIAGWLALLNQSYIKNARRARSYRALIASVTVLGIALGIYANANIFKGSYLAPFDDMDKDGIANSADIDIDGDGRINIEDADADGDGISNAEELQEQLAQVNGVWYDISQSGLIQIPDRMGLVSNEQLVYKVLYGMGVPIGLHMAEDYTVNPEGYAFAPTDPQFDRSTATMRTWAEHIGLYSQRTNYDPGDIIWFESEQVAIIQDVSDRSNPIVLDSHIQDGNQLRPLTEVIEREGRPVGVARFYPLNE